MHRRRWRLCCWNPYKVQLYQEINYETDRWLLFCEELLQQINSNIHFTSQKSFSHEAKLSLHGAINSKFADISHIKYDCIRSGSVGWKMKEFSSWTIYIDRTLKSEIWLNMLNNNITPNINEIVQRQFDPVLQWDGTPSFQHAS